MKMHRYAISFLALVLIAGTIHAAPKKKVKYPPGSITPESVDKAKLPRVILIGDSISIGYTLPVRKLLEDKANVYRAPANCGTTARGLEELDNWLGEKPWDVIHFNWGLHDFKNLGAQSPNQVTAKQYAENLEKLVARLKKTGASLVWCSTTPVPEGAGNGRSDAEAVEYNAIAAGIMKKHGIQVNDLYTFVKNHKGEIQKERNVHFHGSGSGVVEHQTREAPVFLRRATSFSRFSAYCLAVT